MSLAVLTSFIFAVLPPCGQVLDDATKLHAIANRTAVGTQQVPSGYVMFFAENMDSKEIYALVFLQDEGVKLAGGLFKLQGKCSKTDGTSVSYLTAKLNIK